MTDMIKSEQYIARNHDETIRQLAEFFLTDTLIFWSNEEKLSTRQKEKWQPLLDILKKNFDMDIHKTTGLYPVDNDDSQKVFIKILKYMSIKELTACFLAARESKSPLLGLLLAKRQIDASEVFSAAFLEELYQNEFWGTDAAVDNQHNKIKQALTEIEKYLIA